MYLHGHICMCVLYRPVSCFYVFVCTQAFIMYVWAPQLPVSCVHICVCVCVCYIGLVFIFVVQTHVICVCGLFYRLCVLQQPVTCTYVCVLQACHAYVCVCVIEVCVMFVCVTEACVLYLCVCLTGLSCICTCVTEVCVSCLFVYMCTCCGDPCDAYNVLQRPHSRPAGVGCGSHVKWDEIWSG